VKQLLQSTLIALAIPSALLFFVTVMVWRHPSRYPTSIGVANGRLIDLLDRERSTQFHGLAGGLEITVYVPRNEHGPLDDGSVEYATWEKRLKESEFSHRFLGFQIARAACEFPAFAGNTMGSFLLGYDYQYVIPYWFILTIFAIAPAWTLRLLIRKLRTRNPEPGCCARCGYDLCATPQRCPECGAIAMEPVNTGR
jgi:hypothetical protein